MNKQFANLLSPLNIGSKSAPSRIVFAAHQTNLGGHNHFEAAHAAYYAARAAGGAGIIVLEGSLVHASDWPYEYAIFGYDPQVVAGYRLVAQAVREVQPETLLLAQLTHSGGQGSSHYSQRSLWAPSPVPEVSSREVPKVMEVEDIAAVVQGFARTARYAIRAGLDGVEINVGQNSLLRQFLSPLTNMRQDEYGGALENRMRFTREVIQAVRYAVGREAIVGVRLSGDEYAPWAGLKAEDAAEIARLLAEDGHIDFLSITSGSIFTREMTRAGLFAPPGYSAHLAASIKALVNIPVFAQGSIVEPTMAASLINEGQADAVEMTRALISDPNLANKVREGRVEDVRPCILCNQDCVITSIQNPRISCVHNPSAGYEMQAEFSPLTTNSPSPRGQPQGIAPTEELGGVMVIGGGPAGLEAARVAADRGHRVTIYEKMDQLGGTFKVAAAAPGRERLRLAVEWQERQINKLGVTVKTGVTVTPELVAAQAPDAVIVATGGRPQPYPYITVDDEAPLVSPRQVLSGNLPTSAGKAVILDEVGGHSGMGTAEWLADHGWQVEIVSKDMYISQRLAATNEIIPWKQRAPQKGIVFTPQFEVQHVAANAVVGVDVFSKEELRIEPVDLVVSANFELPNQELYFTLKEQGYPVYRAGDCVAPRRLSQAILEGYRAGRAV
ncbi:MAG: FAD-dependent oxidoreductase [Ardenticatenaceae bacterium]